MVCFWSASIVIAFFISIIKMIIKFKLKCLFPHLIKDLCFLGMSDLWYLKNLELWRSHRLRLHAYNIPVTELTSDTVRPGADPFTWRWPSIPWLYSCVLDTLWWPLPSRSTHACFAPLALFVDAAHFVSALLLAILQQCMLLQTIMLHNFLCLIRQEVQDEDSYFIRVSHYQNKGLIR